MLISFVVDVLSTSNHYANGLLLFFVEPHTDRPICRQKTRVRPAGPLQSRGRSVCCSRFLQNECTRGESKRSKFVVIYHVFFVNLYSRHIK